MAKKILTEEERLEQALVPESEWPFELPEGWKWVYIGKITDIVGGGTPSSKVEEYYRNGNISWIRPADLSKYNDIYISEGEKNITELGLEKSSAKLMPKDTVLLSSRAPIGYVAIAEKELCTNQGFKSFLPSKHYDPRYLYWYLKGNTDLLISYASGTTFLELSASRVSKVKFPIPPIDTQKKIVQQIESLFSKLDEAKEKVESVLESSENRKSAILHKAFTGELTKKWREVNGISLDNLDSLVAHENQLAIEKQPYTIPESWRWTTLDKVANIIMGQSPAGKDTTDDKNYTPLIGGAADMGELFPAISRYTKAPKKLSQDGDIILSIRATLGRPIFSDGEYCLGRGVAAIRSDIVSKELLRLYFLTFEEYLYKNSTGSTFSQVSSAVLKNMPFPLIPQQEQSTLVELMSGLLEKEEFSNDYSEMLINQIEVIKKSVLARAYRGERK